jgi:excisionase family DNA binding protein
MNSSDNGIRGKRDWGDLPAIMDVQDLAEFCGIGYRRALEMCHSKGFPTMQLGRGWKINRDGLRRWWEQQTERG